MVAYIKPQHRRKEESEQLRGERYKIKFIGLRFERWQVVGLRIVTGVEKVPQSGAQKADILPHMHSKIFFTSVSH